MKTQQEMEELLKKQMHPGNSGIQQPDLEWVFAARQMIGLRKHQEPPMRSLWESLLTFFKQDLRLYPVGISVLLVFGLMFYLTEPRYTPSQDASIAQSDAILSLGHTTISVNSSTMLTSTPTRLRN